MIYIMHIHICIYEQYVCSKTLSIQHGILITHITKGTLVKAHHTIWLIYLLVHVVVLRLGVNNYGGEITQTLSSTAFTRC